MPAPLSIRRMSAKRSVIFRYDEVKIVHAWKNMNATFSHPDMQLMTIFDRMNIEEFREYCLRKNGVTESTPFPGAPDILVFKVKDKMFVATDINTFASITIKCVPEEIEELRARFPSVKEPAYFSKKHWSKVLLDGSIPDKMLYQFLDTSYDLVVAGLPKKKKLELLQQST